MRLGLVTKREAWCLTWRGRLLGLVLLLVLPAVGLKSCGSFLSLDSPVAADVLIVEGWLPDYALQNAVREFQRGQYRYIITAGSPLLGGYYLSDLKTSAHIAAATLVTFGVVSNQVVAVPSAQVLRGRSFAHARAVQTWLQANDPKVRSVNVYSLGAHARRTRLVFQEVMGSEMKVGVIAHPDGAYDVERWWTSSEGFKTVVEETVGYFWTRLGLSHA